MTLLPLSQDEALAFPYFWFCAGAGAFAFLFAMAGMGRVLLATECRKEDGTDGESMCTIAWLLGAGFAAMNIALWNGVLIAAAIGLAVGGGAAAFYAGRPAAGALLWPLGGAFFAGLGGIVGWFALYAIEIWLRYLIEPPVLEGAAGAAAAYVIMLPVVKEREFPFGTVVAGLLLMLGMGAMGLWIGRDLEGLLWTTGAAAGVAGAVGLFAARAMDAGIPGILPACSLVCLLALALLLLAIAHAAPVTDAAPFLPRALEAALWCGPVALAGPWVFALPLHALLGRPKRA